MEKPYVLIKSPTAGYANIRSKPATGADLIVGKVNDGEKLKYLSSESGYFEVEYETDKTGWVSSTLSELVQ
jgi:uncharacterized protein YgiM (DUF1202 family)